LSGKIHRCPFCRHAWWSSDNDDQICPNPKCNKADVEARAANIRKQDEFFLEQVRSLVGTATRAIEEAESYADAIKDPKLQRQAADIIDYF
jgi:hypothetical protein